MNPQPDKTVKKYKTILADPPWRLQSMSTTAWKQDNPLESKYPTMKLDEISALDVESLSAEDCSLFLWCTHSTLEKALSLMKDWGFKYHCTITWDKKSGFSLWGFHRRTELLLYGYKGTINVNQKGRYIPTLVAEAKTRHSSKPEVVYEILNLNTQAPRIELFARSKRDGWDVWGNEVESDIDFGVTR